MHTVPGLALLSLAIPAAETATLLLVLGLTGSRRKCHLPLLERRPNAQLGEPVLVPDLFLLAAQAVEACSMHLHWHELLCS